MIMNKSIIDIYTGIASMTVDPGCGLLTAELNSLHFDSSLGLSYNMMKAQSGIKRCTVVIQPPIPELRDLLNKRNIAHKGTPGGRAEVL